MHYRSATLTALMFIGIAALLGGCSVVRSVTGTELDGERFAKAREARSMEIRYREAVRLAERLERSNPANEGDVTVQLSAAFLNKFAAFYTGREGWLDESTRYTVDSIHVGLGYGSAIATFSMRASQETWSIDMRLKMDCLVRFGKTESDLEMYFEPYNITPVVESTGFLVGTASMIENVVKAKLGRLSEDFPPLRLPLELDESFPIDNQRVELRDAVNLDITVPRRVVDYTLSLADVLVFREGVYIVLEQKGVRVR